jgi:hypothetical protein
MGLGNLQVFLSADTSQFNKALNKAEQNISSLGSKLTALAASVGVTAFIYKSISAFQEQEDAINNLRISLQSNGDAVTSNLSKFSAYASEMQKQTIYGDELILSQMAFGRNLGITADKLELATTAAIGLAAKYRLDLPNAMMLMGRASQGQTTMLAKYGIVLDESLSPQEKFNKLLEIGAGNFALAQAQTETLSGRLIVAKNAFGEIMEAFGEGISTSFNLTGNISSLTGKIQELTNWFNGIDKPTQTFIFRMGALALGLGVAVPLIIKAYGAIRILTTWTALQSSLMVANTSAQWASITAIGSKIGSLLLLGTTTSSQIVLTELHIASQYALITAIQFVKAAMLGVGVALAAVAVAWVGWEIGKKIAELTGLDKALEDFYGTVFFGIDMLEKEGKKLDDVSKQMEDRKKLLKEIQQITQSGAGRDLLDEEIKKRNELIIQVRTLSDEMGRYGENVEKVIASAMNVSLPDQPIAKLDEETQKAKLKFEEKLQQAYYNEVSDLEKQAFLLEKQASLQEQIKTATGAEKYNLMGKEFDVTEKLDKLKEDGIKKIGGLQAELDKQVEDAAFSKMSNIEKINNLERKRLELLQMAKDSTDEAMKLEMQIQAGDLQKNIESLKGAETKAETGKKVEFAAAVERGTVEAYRAEITKSNKSPENLTAKNTAKSVDIQKQMLEEQRKTNSKLIDFGGNGMEEFALG